MGSAFHGAGAETCPPPADWAKKPFVDGHKLAAVKRDATQVVSPHIPHHPSGDVQSLPDNRAQPFTPKPFGSEIQSRFRCN